MRIAEVIGTVTLSRTAFLVFSKTVGEHRGGDNATAPLTAVASRHSSSKRPLFHRTRSVPASIENPSRAIAPR